jgi:hypothetical protein
MALWIPGQSQLCGSRKSNSACPTRDPVTSSALQKLIKWQEKCTCEFDEFAGNPITRPFCLRDQLWNASIIRPGNRKEPFHVSRLIVVCGKTCYMEIKQRQTENEMCCVGFDRDSAPLKDSNCNQFHKCLLHAVSRSKSSDPNFPTIKSNRCLQINVPEWNSLYGQPSHSSYKQKHSWPLPGTNNSEWWCENSRRSFTLQDYFICQPFQATLPWC